MSTKEYYKKQIEFYEDKLKNANSFKRRKTYETLIQWFKGLLGATDD